MWKTGKSIYQDSRKQARLSRELAAERLNLSIESIGAYERGETKIPCDIVCRMAEVYDDDMLAYRHMSECCAIGKVYLPQIEMQDEPMTVVRLLKETDDVSDLRKVMMAALCDGTVHTIQLCKEVTEQVAAGLAFLFCGKKRTTGVASTSGSVRTRPL